MQVNKFAELGSQTAHMKGRIYSVLDLIHYSKSLPMQDMPLECMDVSNIYPGISSTTEYLSHIKSVQEADLRYPILLDPEGSLLDGRHRVAKALLAGRTHIKFKRFVCMPDPIGWEGNDDD